jgi:hypothetical protein
MTSIGVTTATASVIPAAKPALRDRRHVSFVIHQVFETANSLKSQLTLKFTYKGSLSAYSSSLLVCHKRFICLK